MMDASERAMLAAAVRDALGRADVADAALDEIGWREMLAAEPHDAIRIVFGALGAANAAASVLDDVVVWALGVQPRPDLTVLLPPFGTWNTPDSTGLVSARAAHATELLTASGVVPMTAVELEPVRGIDPDAGLHRARVTPRRGTPAGAVAWEAVVALGQRALGYQIAGATRTMVDLARAHALEREQFGRPIARFQAVRHRLAEALVAVEALDAALAVAGDVADPMAAALAKATAGRTARAVGSHCQQVLAGIGFTTEHPFHRYLKRTMLLDGLLGSADTLTAGLGDALLSTRAVPVLGNL